MASTFPEKRDFGAQAGGATEKARDMASDAASRAKDIASSVTQKVGEAATFVGKRAEDAASAVGGQMKSLSGTIREHAPSSGMAHSATSAVADSLETGGRYLQEHGLSGIGDDVTSLIRRNPVPAVLIGVGLGFILARAISRD